ncbi:unnamed protein product, partial [Oppiella nova]
CDNNKNAIELPEVRDSPPDVRQEYETVSQLIRSENFESVSLIVDKLSKSLNKNTTIPNEISFVVNKEECFGLLGTNGSGKTTTFRLLTGDLNADSGNAYLGSDADLLTNKRQFYSRVGYCPQNDALLDGLTGRQTLVFFGRIRGVERKALEKFVSNICVLFELKAILDKRVTTYSGGNRRKLSLAVALIGRPLVLLLDEPTTGVDPDSRLSIWCLLRDLMVCQKVSIVLTSHNMTECEALCSRLAIVSKGVLKAIGFTAHLKSFYAKGFDLIVKVKSDSNEVIVDEHLELSYRYVNEMSVASLAGMRRIQTLEMWDTGHGFNGHKIMDEIISLNPKSCIKSIVFNEIDIFNVNLGNHLL